MDDEREEFAVQVEGAAYAVRPMKYVGGAIVIDEDGGEIFQFPAWPDAVTAAVLVSIYLRGHAVGRKKGRSAAQYEMCKALGLAFGP